VGGRGEGEGEWDAVVVLAVLEGCKEEARWRMEVGGRIEVRGMEG
jgi:hypothetical protein